VSEKKDEREGKKFCPFLMMVPEFMNSDCEREKCAWWNADMQVCGIAALGNLPYIVEELNHIVIRLGEGR